MASNNRSQSAAHVREAYAIVLMAVSVFFFLSFYSFEVNDIPTRHFPPNSPMQNFVGAVGAWTTYWLACPFGNGVWLLFGLCMIFGIACFVAGEKLRAAQIAWAMGMLASGCGLIQLMKLGTDWQVASAWGLAGGYVGQMIGETLVDWVASAGAYIILFTAWLVSLVMLTGIRPISAALQMADALRNHWQARRTLAEAAAAGVSGNLQRQQRELERQLRAVEKEVKRSGAGQLRPEPAAAEPVLPPQKITIRDHSLPTPTVKQATIPTVTPVGEKAAAKALASAAAAAVSPPPPAPEPKVEKKAERKAEPPPAPPKPVEAEKELPMVEPAPAMAAAMPAAPVPTPSDQSDQSDSAVAAPQAAPPQPVTAKKTATPAKPPPRSAPPPAPVSYKNWQLPTTELLVKASADNPPAQVVEDLKQNAAILQATLADFGLDVRVGEVTKGPVITRYEIYPGAGVKVERITALANNIALAMKAPSVRVLAPIPGKGAVGIEVPNSTTTIVFLRDVLESKEWKTTNARLPLALGKDISGNVIIGDLTDMPHLLIAGATGSGKTVCVNSIIAGLLFRMSPEQLKFVFVDPKIVEMQMYVSLAHLALPIVNDPKKVPLALRWLLSEMEQRYQIFARTGVRNIQAFNSRTAKAKAAAKAAAAAAAEQQEELGLEVPRDDEMRIPDSLPYIIFVVDELADLMMTAPADIEMGITRLAQLARATGIHMVLATQRPSVDVVTGVIKANIPARVAFQVASKQDSRVILDANGADKLLGKGDMLYLPPGSSKLIRAQGVFVQDEEIRVIVEFLEKQAPPSFEREITDKLTREAGGSDMEGEEDEELVEQCVEVIRQTKRASVSILQRRLRIGYTRAARIMDILEERGIVGPHKGAEPRDILVDLDGEIPASTVQ